MRLGTAILAALLATATAPASAHPPGAPLEERITSGLSRTDVPITATFTGSEILVFGAVERNRFFEYGKDEFPDVIIAIRGPSSAVIVRKKERIAGIWTNNAAVRIAAAPGYYSVASTRPIPEILTPFAGQAARVSLDNAVFFAGTPFSVQEPEAFRRAAIRIRQDQGLYTDDSDPVTMIGPSLFSASFALPYNIVEGDYEVRVLLVRNGRVIDERDRFISVHKGQFGARVNAMSTKQPLAYGFLAVFIALAAGWTASEAFRRLRR